MQVLYLQEMPGRRITFRDVFETDQFRDSLQQIEPDARRADDFTFGTKWILCREPEYGTPADPTGLVWTVDTEPDIGPPQLTIHYSWDDDSVTLHDIEIKPEDP